MPNSTHRILFFLLISFCNSSCLDEIRLRGVEPGGNNLVITGYISKSDESEVQVTINRLADFGDLAGPEPVVNADVFVRDQNGGEIYIPSQEDGSYILSNIEAAPNFELATGNSYQLFVTTMEGIDYQSDLELLPEVPTPDSISLQFLREPVLNEAGNIVDAPFLDFFLHTPLNQEGSYLKWEFDGCYAFLESLRQGAPPPPQDLCYVLQDLDLENIVLFDGTRSNSSYLSNFKVLRERADYRFYLGFYLLVEQQSISATAFQYWDNVRELVSLGGNLFETSPGTIGSNIHRSDGVEEDVFGFFYAREEKLLRLKVNPVDANYPSEFCPPETTVPQICANCLRIPNSSLIRPDYWE